MSAIFCEGHWLKPLICWWTPMTNILKQAHKAMIAKERFVKIYIIPDYKDVNKVINFGETLIFKFPFWDRKFIGFVTRRFSIVD